MSNTKTNVFTTLKQAGELSAKDLAAVCEMSETSTRQALGELMKEGKVIKNGAKFTTDGATGEPKKAKAAKAPAAPKAPKAPKEPKVKEGPNMRDIASKRREDVVAQLKAAGKNGATVEEMAAALNEDAGKVYGSIFVLRKEGKVKKDGNRAVEGQRGVKPIWFLV